MAKIINGRVRQKAAPLAEWQNSDLESLDGEQLFVRSDVDDAVIGFKFGARGKKFSELPYPDLTVRDKATPSMSWSGRQSGVYIPTINGNYNGVNVNLTDGYQVLYWDGSTVQKVVYPTDYTGAVFGGVIDDTYDLSTPPTEPTWYIASAGTYNTTPPTTLTETSILTWNGQSWSHIPFELEIRGEFLVADNIQEVRNITPEVAQLLVNGTYKGVTVLGYYEPDDTPAPINYYLSDTSESDDGGSVIEVGDIKLEHKFTDVVNTLYFGLSDTISLTPNQKLNIIQKTFNVSNKSNIPQTIISQGEHVIESPGLTFNNSNSVLIFEGSLKLKDNDSTILELTGCRLIAYSGYNIEVINQKIDGNRDNQVHNTQIGTQFSFTYYTYNNLGGITFRGGWCINSIQSHCQFIASEVKFENYSMRVSGEHGIYYSLQVGGVAGKLLQLTNCEIIDNGIISGGSSITTRAVRKGLYTNCKLDNGSTAKGGQCTIGAHYYAYRGSLLVTGEEFLHKYVNCEMKASTETIYTVGCRGSSETPDPLTVKDHMDLNRGIIVDGGSSNFPTSDGVLKAINHELNLSVGNKITLSVLPREIINSQIRHLYRYRPTINRDLTIENCYLLNSDPEVRDIFNNNDSTETTFTKWSFLNNTFDGFYSGTSTGITIIRASNVNNYISVNITNNRYLRSGLANISNTGLNPNIVIANNTDLDDSNINFILTSTVLPKAIYGNSFIREQGTIAQRPSGTVRHVNQRYFNIDGPNYQMWNGTSWINTNPPNASTSTFGLVKQGVHVPNGSSIDTLLTSLRNAGVIASS